MFFFTATSLAHGINEFFPGQSVWLTSHLFLCFSSDTPQYIIIMTNSTENLGVTLLLDIHHLEVITKFGRGEHLQSLINAWASLIHVIWLLCVIRKRYRQPWSVQSGLQLHAEWICEGSCEAWICDDGVCDRAAVTLILRDWTRHANKFLYHS